MHAGKAGRWGYGLVALTATAVYIPRITCGIYADSFAGLIRDVKSGDDAIYRRVGKFHGGEIFAMFVVDVVPQILYPRKL